MLEFVFFDPRPQQKFADFLRRHQVPLTESEEHETFGIAIPEDVNDVLLERIEAQYDELMAMDRELFEADADAADKGHQAAGVVLNLVSGATVYAQVDPLLLGRIMQVLTPQEFGEVVNAIVDAVENPDARSLCRRAEDAD